MIGLRAIARPYAKAIFNLAVSHQQLAEWSEWLALVAKAMENPRLKKWLQDPMIQNSQIFSLFQSFFPHLPSLQKNFLHLLVQYRRLDLLPEIAWWYENFRSERENILVARVTTTYALTDEQSAELTQALENYFSKKIVLTCQEDASLLGGLVIRIGDQILDGSGRKRLKALKKQLRGIHQ